jgi:hypothetical protein
LLGGIFKFYTKHYVLKYFVNKFVLEGHISKWLLIFQEFSFQVVVKLGRNNNVPIFRFPCSTVGDDLMGLCQPDQRGNLRLTMSSSGLEELYDAFKGPSYHLSSLGSFLHNQISISLHFDRSRNLGVLLSII